MKIFFKAHGSPSLLIFLIRLVIGGTFLLLGAKKMLDVEAFINYLKSLNAMPPNLAFIMGFLLPLAEIIFGAFYLIGLFTPFTSLIMTVMLLGILSMTPSVAYQPYTFPSATGLYLMLVCTIGTIFSGAGYMSFDALIDKPKKKINQNQLTVTEKIYTNEPVVETPPAASNETLLNTSPAASNETKNK